MRPNSKRRLPLNNIDSDEDEEKEANASDSDDDLGRSFVVSKSSWTICLHYMRPFNRIVTFTN